MWLKDVDRKLFLISLIVFSVSVLFVAGILFAEKMNVRGKITQMKMNESKEKVLPGSFWDDDEYRLL